MTTRGANVFSIALVAALTWVVTELSGCGSSPPARFYTLDSTAQPADAPSAPVASYAVAVGPVSIPASIDRPQFVLQVAPNLVALSEFERWASPLDDSIARAIAGNLTILLGTPSVVTSKIPDFTPACRVAIAVQRFDSIPNEAVIVEAFWTVRDVASAETYSGFTAAREPVQGPGFDVLAAAHSRALGKVSSDIAAAIRGRMTSKSLPTGSALPR